MNSISRSNGLICKGFCNFAFCPLGKPSLYRKCISGERWATVTGDREKVKYERNSLHPRGATTCPEFLASIISGMNFTPERQESGPETASFSCLQLEDWLLYSWSPWRQFQGRSPSSLCSAPSSKAEGKEANTIVTSKVEEGRQENQRLGEKRRRRGTATGPKEGRGSSPVASEMF